METIKNLLVEHIEMMSDENAQFLYGLLNLGKYPSKTDVMRLCGEGERNFDTAYPSDYMRRVEEVYPNAIKGSYVYDYTENTVFGELVNVNDILAKRISELFNNQF